MRLFISVPISVELKKEIGEYQQTLRHLPLRLTSLSNLHITLVFLGEVAHQDFPAIENAIQKTLANFGSRTSKIFLIPLGFEPGPKKRFPGLIWLSFKPSEVLATLQTRLAWAFKKVGERQFTPHVTVARVIHNGKLNPDSVPSKKISQALSFAPKEIHLMASALKRGGAEYTTLKTFPL